MKKTLQLLLIGILLISSAFAGNVSIKDAKKAGKSFYYQSINSVEPKAWDDISLTLAYEAEDMSSYYIFNVNGDEGFLVVSSENTVKPVLAYSFEGAFNKNNISVGQQAFLTYYKDEIKLAQTVQIKENIKATNEWNELLSYSPSKGLKQKTTVGPFLLANWNQDWPYNAQCPSDSDGDHGHVYVGCVATAMLQVMKYYNYPEVGEGSKTHISWVNGGYGNITVNFAAQNYDWNSMPNDLMGDENDETAKINFHAGVAVSMYWGPDGSGSQTSRIVTALESFFRYDDDVQLKLKSSYSDSQWRTILKGQLNQGQPMVYSGESTTVGHAWNCDGYQDDDNFHMNWGWGGAGNGYYTLDNLVSTATPGGPENDFSTGQEAVVNIYPRENYPLYCTGSTLITGNAGAFGDGSSNTLYQNNQSCEYIIEPECGSIVQLKFETFDLAEGDVVYVYNGNNTDEELLEVFDADNVPPYASMISGDKGAITIQFVTDNANVAQGWDASFTTRNCKTNIIYADASGTVNDGSGPCDYSNSTVCSWYIQPGGAEWVSLDFTEFDLGGNIDFVKVFDGELNGTVLGDFNHNNEPSGQIMANSGIAVIQFFADANTNGTGWTVNYSSSLTSSEEYKLISGVQLYPNPSNGNAKLGFSLDKTGDVTISISDILGKTISLEQLYLQKGFHTIGIKSISNTVLKEGIYFVNLDCNGVKTSQKLVVIE